MVLRNPYLKVSALPKPASALASISLLHIQGHYFHNSAAPLHHRFFHFLLKQFYQYAKILLCCYFSHLKQQKNTYDSPFPASH